MAADVVMPQMGESIFEGTITKWLKKPGDKVERDEPLFEISTDKVDAEIPSPSAGVLKEIKVKEGQTVPINTVVATIDGASSAAAAPAPAVAPAPKAEAPKPAAVAPAATPASKPGPVPVPSSVAAAAAFAPAKEGVRIHSSPLVRRMAKEHGIDLATVPGTGAGGRISKQDIEAAISGSMPAAEPAYSAPAAQTGPAAATSGCRSAFARGSRSVGGCGRRRRARHAVCAGAATRCASRTAVLRQLRSRAAFHHAPENR